MELLQRGIDRSVIALWLGHESVETTQMYLHADLRLKEQALSRTSPVTVKLRRYRPDDKLLAFLEGLWHPRGGKSDHGQVHISGKFRDRRK